MRLFLNLLLLPLAILAREVMRWRLLVEREKQLHKNESRTTSRTFYYLVRVPDERPPPRRPTAPPRRPNWNPDPIPDGIRDRKAPHDKPSPR